MRFVGAVWCVVVVACFAGRSDRAAPRPTRASSRRRSSTTPPRRSFTTSRSTRARCVSSRRRTAPSRIPRSSSTSRSATASWGTRRTRSPSIETTCGARPRPPTGRRSNGGLPSWSARPLLARRDRRPATRHQTRTRKSRRWCSISRRRRPRRPGSPSRRWSSPRAPAAAPETPFYRRGWFWVVTGAVIAGAATTIIVLSTRSDAEPFCPDCAAHGYHAMTPSQSIYRRADRRRRAGGSGGGGRLRRRVAADRRSSSRSPPTWSSRASSTRSS